MKIVKNIGLLTSIISFCGIIVGVQSGCAADFVKGRGAGVLVTFLDEKNERWMILARESQGILIRGTYDAFSGGRDKKDVFPHGTAGREWWEESMGAFLCADTVDHAISYLDLDSPHVLDVIIKKKKGKALFIVSIDKEDARRFKKQFFVNKKKREAAHANAHLLEKDAIAYIKWSDFITACHEGTRNIMAHIIESSDGCKESERVDFITLRKGFFKRCKKYCLSDTCASMTGAKGS